MRSRHATCPRHTACILNGHFAIQVCELAELHPRGKFSNPRDLDSNIHRRPCSWQLVRPGRQGPFNQVKRNFWHVILVMDMTKSFSLSTISQTAQQMIKRGIPFRIGLVPLITDSNDDMSGWITSAASCRYAESHPITIA